MAAEAGRTAVDTDSTTTGSGSGAPTRPEPGGVPAREATRFPASGLAMSLTVAAVLMVLSSLLIGLGLPARERMVMWHPELVLALTWTPVAALLLRHRPRLTVGWVMLISGLAAALYVMTLNLGPWLTLHDRPGAGVVTWLSLWFWAIDTFSLTLVLPLIFPDGRLVSRWFAPVLALACLIPLIVAVHLTIDPDVRGLDHGVTTYPLQDVPLVMSAMIIGTLVLGLVSVVFRFIHSPEDVRRQIAWVIYPGVIAQLIVFIGESTPIGNPLRDFTIATVPICIAIAITRYRLYDIDIVINRSLVYLGVAGVITGVYFALVGAASLVVADRGPAAGLIGAIAAGAVFEPVRRRLQRTVDRLLHGERDPYRIADRLNRRLQSASDPSAALAIAASTVREALRAEGVVIEVHDRERRTTRAEDGETGTEVQVIPLIWHGEPMGRLLFTRLAGTPDNRLASIMARNLAELANAVRLATDVHRSRERILTTREEERRRLRRDLHDGLGPTLASLAMTIDAARITLRRDPQAVDPLLESLRTTMARTIGDIRELVYGLRPPALDDLGLAGAMRALADNVSGSGGPRVEVQVDDDVHDLPAAVEVAAYRIVQEALTNVRRHSGAGRAVVSVRRFRHAGGPSPLPASGGAALAEDVQGTQGVLSGTDGELHVSVRDDGTGINARNGGHTTGGNESGGNGSNGDGSGRRLVAGGVGLASMRERAAELGGACVIRSDPAGGTSVLARLPINASEIEA